MTIKEYIMKNLPNFNWNILPQIFAENGVEMNEEIKAYLRNTPENTNWNVFDGISRSQDRIKWYQLDGYNTCQYFEPEQYDSNTQTSTKLGFAACIVNLSYPVTKGEVLKVVINGKEKIIKFDYDDSHNGFNNIEVPNFTSTEDMIAFLESNPEGFYTFSHNQFQHYISLENAPTLHTSIPISIFCIDDDIPNTTLPKRLRYQWKGITRSDFSSWEEAYNFCLEHATENTEVANKLNISNDYVIVQDDSGVIWNYPGKKDVNGNAWFWGGSDDYYCYLTQDDLNIGYDN
jgi:hypothetical protein